MKNILAENMRRFNTKNLTEQTNPIKFDEKYFMNKKTGVITFDDNGKVISVDNIPIQPKYYDFQWKETGAVRSIESSFNSGELDGGEYDWTYIKIEDGGSEVVFFNKQKQEVGKITYTS
jgi:hypothetical protein